MDLRDYQPIAKLVTKVTQVDHPRFPVIDAHNHLGDEFGGGLIHHPLSELLDTMDQAGVRRLVDLDGMVSEEVLNLHLDRLKSRAPERFRVFGGVDWSAWPTQGDKFGEWAAARLRVQKARGADGLKVWKPFGLQVCDQHGQLVAVDDTRLDPLWETAAELDLPVAIHVADPVAFFDPLDKFNERWEEIERNPAWHFESRLTNSGQANSRPPYPPFLFILESLARLVERHPRTTFIGAHVGCYAENLGWVSALLERCPNFYIDISARLGELGRQPYSARRFFIKYSDRILFGTDMGLDIEGYRRHYRFLETDDEYFNYAEGEVPSQGRWYAYGLYLPDEVLEKVYYQNAEKVI